MTRSLSQIFGGEPTGPVRVRGGSTIELCWHLCRTARAETPAVVFTTRSGDVSVLQLPAGATTALAVAALEAAHQLAMHGKAVLPGWAAGDIVLQLAARCSVAVDHSNCTPPADTPPAAPEMMAEPAPADLWC